MDEPILSDETLALIKNTNPAWITSEKNGRRSVSRGLVTPPTSSRATSSFYSSDDTSKYVDVPTRLNSAPTFEFLGFSTQKAVQLFENMNEQFTILKQACDWVSAICSDIEDYTDDWNAAMVQAGVKQQVRDALLRSEHRAIRHTQPLANWLCEIIETNYYALIDLNATILAELDPTSKNNSAQLQFRGGGDDYTVPQMPGDHLALFKSVEGRRCKNCIAEDGSVDLGRLESSGPTDFARRGGLYFTQQLWVARHYSALITDACPVADRRTVEMHVPLSHFAEVKTWELSFADDEWKQLLFYSRRDEKYPKKLSQQRAQYGVVHGPIGHTHNRAFAKMKTWEDVSEKHQLQLVEGQETLIGKQHVWIREEIISKLEDAVHGKTYIRRPERNFELVPRPWVDLPSKVED